MIGRLQNLQWIDEETRQEAIEKVKSLREKIGYPDYILSPLSLATKYSGLWAFSTNQYFENIVLSDQWDVQDNLKKITKPVDFGEFDMTPATVNAYYNPPLNEIVFPAGILAGGFYSHNNPIYLNYGAIGSVISHELTHAFDNNGREFDSHGQLRDWWSNSTAAEFEKFSTCFVNQYTKYTMIDPAGNPQNLNGLLTLGENLADNGIMRSYEAYKMEVRNDRNANNQRLPGLTQYDNDQLFYLAFGQIWCNAVTPAQAIVRLRTDPHSPGKYRVNGVVANSPHFANVYKCPKNAKMNPQNKCLLW
jgi:predicted metalloendopeptidase